MFREIATSEYFFNGNIISKFYFVVWKICNAKTFLFHLLPTRCSNGKKKSFFFEVAKMGQSPKCLLFSFLSLFFLCCCCALHFPIAIEIPPQKLLFLEPVSTEARGGKGLLGHPVSLAAVEARTGQQRGEEGFQVPSGRFSRNYWRVQSKAQRYFCFLLSTKGPGPRNSNIILCRKLWVLILNL